MLCSVNIGYMGLGQAGKPTRYQFDESLNHILVAKRLNQNSDITSHKINERASVCQETLRNIWKILSKTD